MRRSSLSSQSGGGGVTVELSLTKLSGCSKETKIITTRMDGQMDREVEREGNKTQERETSLEREQGNRERESERERHIAWRGEKDAVQERRIEEGETEREKCTRNGEKRDTSRRSRGSGGSLAPGAQELSTFQRLF